MANMIDYAVTDYKELLAGKSIDVSNGVLFSAALQIPPDTHNRTILIGLGGTGMQTIDHVKGVISRRLDPSWKDYVAFLGIDSSANEMKNMKHLRAPEDTFVCTTIPGADDRMHNNAYPSAWRRFVDPAKTPGLPSLNSDGANRTRYIGKIKAHDQTPGGLGVDEQIVAALAAIKGSRLTPLAGLAGTIENYEVYVIGSVCGGTCSGTFLEMPALIRRALNTPQLHIHALLYLPDTLTTLDPTNKAELEANGYASLKELNYFEGINMRDGYTEAFAYNDPAAKTLDIGSHDDFYTLPYLVGTLSGPAADSAQRARETIAEYLISLLGKVSVPDGTPFLVESFVSNAQAHQSDRLTNPSNTSIEATGEHHEFPRRYAAIGFAEASAPKKLARAYAIGKSCSMAGIKPVPKDIRDALIGTTDLLPFRAADDLLGATVGTQEAKQLLEPLAKLLEKIHVAGFNMKRDLNLAEVTWDGVRQGTYDTPQNQTLVKQYIANKVTTANMAEIETAIREAMNAVMTRLQDYVKQEGPLAYANLYYGKFAKDTSGFGTGVREMLQNLEDGKIMGTGQPYRWTTPDAADSALAQQKQAILQMPTGLLKSMTASDKRKTAAALWVQKYNEAVNAKIIKAKRDYFLNATGKIHEMIVAPMALLADQLQAFGNILIAMSDIYMSHGGSLDTYDTFKDAQDSVTEVNIASVDVSSYNWLKQRADASVQAVNAKAFRDAIINNFFGQDESGRPNRLRWMEVPQDCVKQTVSGAVTLANESVAVPAREMFDHAISTVVGDDTDVTIDLFFTQMDALGTDVNSIAIRIMQKLASTSQPLFHGTIPASCLIRSIMYPATLDTTPVGTSGVTVGTVVRNAAAAVFPGAAIQVYGSSDAGSIVMYQMANPFEVYRLADLAQWEAAYEVRIQDHGTGKFLHGYSPLVREKNEGYVTTFEEQMTWKDFPAITNYSVNITERDPATGRVSREGQLRLELHDLVERAKLLGVLYEDTDIDEKYFINRVFCDLSVPQWQMDVTMMQPDAIGLLPLGRALAEQVALQNGKTLAGISKKVLLVHGGVLASPVDESDLAWNYAEKVLRANPRMYLEVKSTVEKFGTFAESIIQYNKGVMQMYNPAKMIKLIQAQVLYTDASGAWKLRKIKGGDKLITNLSENSLKMLKMVSGKDYAMVANGLKGYYLFTKLMAVFEQPDMKTEQLDDYLDFAKKDLEKKMLEGNHEAIQAGVDAANFIMEEREALEAKNARLEEIEQDKQPWDSFVSEMSAIHVTSLETIKEIRKFYNRVVLADMV